MTHLRLGGPLAVAVFAAVLGTPQDGRGQAAREGRAPVVAQVPEPLAPQAVQRADSLADAGDMEGAYRLLSARLDVAPGDADALQAAVRVALGLGIVGPTHAIRIGWLRTADAHGRALQPLRPRDPDALAWTAAARGQLAMAEDGARTAADLGQEVWALTEALLAQAPDHPLGNDVRGKLHQQAMRLNRVKRFLARTFLGADLVRDASWEGAEAHLERAVAGDPGMVLFRLDLGDTYRYQGKADQAARTYREALALPERLPVDAHLKQVVRRRLERMGR